MDVKSLFVTQIGPACLCRWWACKPAPATTAAQTSLVLAAAFGDQAAAASAAGGTLAKELVDMLVISHAPRAKRSSKVVVKVALNRQGLPVPNTKVFVQVTTTDKAGGSSSTTTIASTTNRSGSATVVLPAKAKGTAGSRSIIQAFTNDARASGVKGGVAIMSQTGRMAWR